MLAAPRLVYKLLILGIFFLVLGKFCRFKKALRKDLRGGLKLPNIIV